MFLDTLFALIANDWIREQKNLPPERQESEDPVLGKITPRQNNFILIGLFMYFAILYLIIR